MRFKDGSFILVSRFIQTKNNHRLLIIMNVMLFSMTNSLNSTASWDSAAETKIPWRGA